MGSHPLDDALDVASSEEVSEIFGMNVQLPEDPTMRDVVLMALKQYKSLVEDSQLLEPDQRLPTLELAKQYLDLAKDTMYKESDLQIKHKNADARIKGKGPQKQIGHTEGEGEGGGSVSRDELLQRRSKKK